MQDSLHQIAVKTTNSFHVVSFRLADLRSPEVLHEVEHDFNSLLAEVERECVIVDFSHVEHAASGLFGAVLHLADSMAEKSVSLRVAGMNDGVASAFEMLDPSGTVDIYDDVDLAVHDPVRAPRKKPWWKFW